MKTRAAEWMLSWIMVMWGLGVFVSYHIGGAGGGMTAFLSVLGPLDLIALLIVGFGAGRMIALLYNGHWRRSPILRMAAAIIGMMFWQAIFVFYGLAVVTGKATFFPMLLTVPVFFAFEAYSAYRCGQDASVAHSFRFDCIQSMKARLRARVVSS